MIRQPSLFPNLGVGGLFLLRFWVWTAAKDILKDSTKSLKSTGIISYKLVGCYLFFWIVIGFRISKEKECAPNQAYYLYLLIGDDVPVLACHGSVHA